MMAALFTTLRNIGGTDSGAIFRITPPYVDRKLLPGESRMPLASFRRFVTTAPMLMVDTPNLIWALIAIVIYFAFPYDLSPIHEPHDGGDLLPLSARFFASRFPLWAGVVLSYVAFWHVTLCCLHWTDRPFIAKRPYSLDKLAHNVLWTTVGVAVWVCIENVFVFLWATGRLSYETDAAALTSLAGIARFAAVLWGIPVWRSFHFFFSHYLLHFKPLYRMVHSLHHRNSDIEPFAGLSMHPVEHLYYFAAFMPSLLLFVSPFALLWNGVHLLLSPAASHSGFEDHWGADTYHYMHHRYFDVNFGDPDSSFLDNMFGTFCDRFRDSDRKEGGAKLRSDSKSMLRQLPTFDSFVYLVLVAGCMAGWARQALVVAAGAAPATSAVAALVLALLAGFGPILSACFVSSASSACRSIPGRSSSSVPAPASSSGGPVGGVKKSPGKDTLSTCLLLVVGCAFTSVPVAHACYLALMPAGFAYQG